MGHGIGVKRNDYHRRNRKRHISMHKKSDGAGKGFDSTQQVESIPISGYVSRLVEKFNRVYAGEQKEEWQAVYESECGDNLIFGDGNIFVPPFLSPNDIRERRFGANPTDRWWEWESEVNLTPDDTRPRRSLKLSKEGKQ